MAEQTHEPSMAGARVAHAMLFLFALFLAVSFPTQVKWFDNLPLHGQPGMWALISVSGMLITGATMAYNTFRGPASHGTGKELAFWLRSIEFLAWFMVYVFVVPYAGYLPSTLLFSIALTWRLGYRRKRMIFAAALLAIATVVVFRSLLHVRVPGGLLYEFFPQPLSKFLLTYL